jgi:hypothetical protein
MEAEDNLVIPIHEFEPRIVKHPIFFPVEIVHAMLPDITSGIFKSSIR